MRLLVRSVLDRPHPWLLGGAALTLVLGAGLFRLELKTDGQSLRPLDAPELLQDEEDSRRFHDPRQAVLVVTARSDGPLLSTPEGFRFLGRVQRELRVLPEVSDGILSAPSLPRLEQGGGGFSLGTFFDDVPESPEAFATLLAAFQSRRLATGLLLSDDGRRAAFYVPLAEDFGVLHLVDALEAWREGFEARGFELAWTGPEVAEALLGRKVLFDLAVLVPVMLAVIVVALLLVVGSVGAVAVAMVEALLVLIWTLGAMGWAGVPVTLVTTILPVVLMAMSITDEIHLLERVAAVRDERRDASWSVCIERALGQVAGPIAVTSVTTAIGFLSFMSAGIEPLRHFGLFTAFGILAAMVLSFTWIPALMLVMPERWFEPRGAAKRARRVGEAERPGFVVRAVTTNPTRALLVGIVLFSLAAPGLGRLRVEDAWVDNFDPEASLVVADRGLNESFWGSYTMDVVFEAERDFFHTPVGAELFERVHETIDSTADVGGVLSYVDYLDEVVTALGVRRPLSSLSGSQVADAATVTRMSGDRLRLRQLITDDGTAARLRIFVRDASYERAIELRGFLDEKLPALAAPYPVRYHYSGDLLTALAVVETIVGNQVRSIAWTLAGVGLSLALVFSGLRGAAVAMLPVLAAVVTLLALMGYVGVPLGIATSMFASLSVGVGVDFAVHLLYRYRQERETGVNDTKALRNTFATAGRAVTWNALVLAAGFLVLTLSTLRPNHSLGLLLAAAVIAAWGYTTLLLPRLLRFTASVLVTAFLVAGTSASAWAEDSPCVGAAPDSKAHAVMAALEAQFREHPRIVRMDIETRYGESSRLAPLFKGKADGRSLWGVFDGDADTTRMLYVFSGPGRLAGTTLLLHDHVAHEQSDGLWFYLRSFDSFSKLEADAQRVMVPGTPLTYADSRGFLPVVQYSFSLLGAADGERAQDAMRILACPKGTTVRENTSYSAIELSVDPALLLVRHALCKGLGGKDLKSYELLADSDVAGRRLPSRVRMKHLVADYTTEILYEHWSQDGVLPPGLFAPNSEPPIFLDRMQAFLTERGLGDRIDAEIAKADARIQAYEDRVEELRERAKRSEAEGEGEEEQR